MLYDVLVVSAIAVAFAGIVWGSAMVERHRREIRIHKKIKADPYLGGIELPKYLLRLFEATFRRNTSDGN